MTRNEKLEKRVADLEVALARQHAINTSFEAILPYLGRELHYRQQWVDLQDALREAR